MSQPVLKHIVCITGCGWSHVRPIVKFCTRLAAKFPNVFISIYTHSEFLSQTNRYLAAHPQPALERILIRASAISSPGRGALDLLRDMEEGFGPWISEELSCPKFERNGLAVERPRYIIEDHLNGGISVANKQFHQLPIVGWYVATATGFLGHFSSAEYGQGWRHFEAVRATVAKHGLGNKTLLEIYAQEVIHDRVVCAPGVPPHYEHEQIPQTQLVVLPMIIQMHERWTRMLESVTGMAYTSLYEMEPIAAEASTFGLLNPIPSFCVGLAADEPPSTYPSLDENSQDPVILFMNRAYTELGPHSVVYVSFGSFCFPAPESISHLKILIEGILYHGFRLVFSAQMQIANKAGLDREHIDNLASTGQAIFPEWTNQLQVLEHMAMHYFISHGGWNSTSEAIMRGVPIIFWPIAGDQPNNAMQMTRQLDCGFELLQVRSGVARSVAYSFDRDITITGSDDAVRDEVRRILKTTKGPRGEQQRLNIKTLGRIAAKSHETEGSADLALKRFGALLGL